MKEIRSILQQYDKIKSTNKKMALATVVYVEGSSYRREGARMLVVEDGTWIGGISGGCLEGDALRKAKNAIVKDQSSIVRYDTREEDAFQIGVGLGCNGIIDVLITPLGNETNSTIKILKDCVNSRIANILITFIDPVDRNSKGDMILGKENILQQHIDNQHIIDLIGIELDLIREEQKSKIYRIEESGNFSKVFFEFLPPETRLILFGSNYDIYPLVDIANDIGWDATVVCNPQKVDKSLFDKAKVVSNKSKNLNFDHHTAAILMAHDYKTDMQNLQLLLDSDIGYIGMLGPKVRSQKIFNELSSSNINISKSDHLKIHAPIGLDTGATSPEEIAIAMVAEIRAFYSQRDGGFLRDRSETIHERR